MNNRQQELLKLVIENHVQMAEPVGSRSLVSSGDLGWSEATVRNELRALEEAHFLTHPHTSAGRIPTSKGYQYYVENIMKPIDLKKSAQNKLETIWKEKDEPNKKLKTIGKALADNSNAAVIVAFSRDNLYYTGISYLFSQPEFSNAHEIASLSGILDQCEKYIDELFAVVQDDKTFVLIGDNNPLGEECSLVTAKFMSQSLLALLGPLRMNYQQNIALVDYVRKLVAI